MVKNMQQPSNTARAAANNCHVESVEKSPRKLIHQPLCSSLPVTFLKMSHTVYLTFNKCVKIKENLYIGTTFL